MIGNISEIKYIKGFMKKNDASLIYDYAKNHSEKFSEYGNDRKEFLTNNQIFNKDMNKNVQLLMQQYAKMVYNFVVNQYSETSFLPFIPELTHIAKFSDGDSMHQHFDVSRPNDIATLIYINDNYEGGEIFFPEYDLFIKPESGDLVTFPDNEKFVHGVKKVINGDRYTMPRWFTRQIW